MTATIPQRSRRGFCLASQRPREAHDLDLALGHPLTISSEVDRREALRKNLSVGKSVAHTLMSTNIRWPLCSTSNPGTSNRETSNPLPGRSNAKTGIACSEPCANRKSSLLFPQCLDPLQMPSTTSNEFAHTPRTAVLVRQVLGAVA
jgi:hypothetical protein